MAEHSRLGDFILGLQGVAILRNHWIDPAAVRAWTRSIAEVAGKIDEEPWSEPWHAEERTVRAQYAAWAAEYDAPGNPMVMAEEPVVHELLVAGVPDGALSARRGVRNGAARRIPGVPRPRGHRHRLHARNAGGREGQGAHSPIRDG